MSTPVIEQDVSTTNPILFTEFRDNMHASLLKELRRFVTGVAGEAVAERVLAADLSALTGVLNGYAATIAVVANASGAVPHIDMDQDGGRWVPAEPCCSRCGSTDVAMDILSGSYDRMADMVIPNELSDKGHFCNACVHEGRVDWKPVADPTQLPELDDVDAEEEAGAEA